jgi:hypothetical protein
MANTVTRTDYVNWLKSKQGGYGPARGKRNNDNEFNTEFYGHEVGGDNYAWCVVLQWAAMHHFGIDEINGGRNASVPKMPEVAKKCGAKVWNRPKRTAKGPWEPGNRVGFDLNGNGSGDHTGTYIAPRDESSFWSFDGNTSTARWSDAAVLKIRYYKDVLFVVELLGVGTKTSTSTKGTDDVPGYVSLGLKKPMPVKMGQSVKVQFDLEASDKGNRHADRDPAPGILVGGKNGTFYVAQVDVQGPATWTLVETNPDDDYSVHDHNETGGPDLCDPNMHLWLMVHPTGDGEVDARVKTLYWDR